LKNIPQGLESPLFDSMRIIEVDNGMSWHQTCSDYKVKS